MTESVLVNSNKDIVPELTEYDTYITNLQWQIDQKQITLQPNQYIDIGNNLKCKFLEK